MKAVLIYGIASNTTMESLVAAFPRHKALIDEFSARGDVLGIGSFSDRTGALAIFKTRNAAEAFVKADPLVLEGLVGSYELKEWADIFQ
ncbi:MAG TPA: YciI family protein [Hyphomicrobium sp.]|jgi:hypothetical protein